MRASTLRKANKTLSCRSCVRKLDTIQKIGFRSTAGTKTEWTAKLDSDDADATKNDVSTQTECSKRAKEENA